MDAPAGIARSAALSVTYLHARIRPAHPTAPLLGVERQGAACAVGPHRLLTAHYLVLGADSLEVQAADGRERHVTRTTLDHDTGLALLHLDGPPLQPLACRSAPARAGLPVFVLTFKDAHTRRGADGYISSAAPFEAFWEYRLERALFSTIVNPGLAGGPLLDLRGQVVGVVSLGLSAVARYSLAVPVELYLEQSQELEAGRPRSLCAPRAWMGVYIQVRDGGLVLAGVVPQGPAHEGGLVRGDFVVSVDGDGVATLRELYQSLWRHAPGRRLHVRVLRAGALRELRVVAGDRHAFYA